jgi:outer membrane protein assembly factor BamC
VNRFAHPARQWTVLAIATALTACSSLDEDKINYKSASKASTLEVPPDLTQLRKDSRYILDSNSAAASGFQGVPLKAADNGTASNSAGDARMERSGNQRWLVVNRPADKVWGVLQDFWKDNGFVLTTEQAELGIMETDWAENRAKLPQDFIRKSLGRVLDSLYSTGERDRFRTRIERNAQGGVEIYISHRGMIENYTDGRKEQTLWQPRPADPELEIEFMRRLMLKFGGATAPVGSSAAAPTAGTSGAAVSASGGVSVSQVNNLPVIELKDDFDRAWRRLGVALDRTSFTVEDRDRSKGVYFVRYVPAGATGKEPGFFAKLFSKDSTAPALTKYSITLTHKAGVSIISVLNAEGAADTSDNAEKILKLIAGELK